MRKASYLALSVAVALTGCGGGDSTNNESPQGTQVTAIDGYLSNAQVWVDMNNNFNLDNDDIQLSENTDANGQFTLPAEYATNAIFIQAIAGQTIDTTRGLVENNFVLAASAGSTTANPMTNMVIQQLAANPDIDEAQARANVVSSLNQAGLEVNEELIFGDYLAAQSDSAQALNVIGETLVDNAALPVAQQLTLSSGVASEAQKIIDDPQLSLDDFSPIVAVPEQGEPTVSPNSRPVYKVEGGALTPVALSLGDAWPNIDASAYFSDADGDVLNYRLSELSNKLNGLSINASTGVISVNLSAQVAGEFNYQIIAADTHGAKSYPLALNVTIDAAGNSAPTVNSDEQARLQQEISTWELQEGVQITNSLDVSSLFQDEDGDTLTYRAASTLTVTGPENDLTGFQVAVNSEGLVSFDGPVPFSAAAGAEHLYIWAKDSSNEDEPYARFELPEIAEAATPPTEPTHDLEGTTWYVIEHGSDDGDGDEKNDFSRIWCDTLRFENGEVLANTRSNSNKTECSTELEVVATYYVEGEELNAVFSEVIDGTNYVDILAMSIESAADEISTGAKTIVLGYSEDNQRFHERYTYFTNKADAETRLNIKSDGDGAARTVDMYLPSETEETWKLGKLSVSMGPNTESDSAAFDANVFMEIPGEDFSCTSIRELYESFVITGDNIGYNYSGNNGVFGELECYDNQENGVTYAAIDFDIANTLTVGNVYSIIGKVKDEQGEFVEAVKLNIEWTGESNND